METLKFSFNVQSLGLVLYHNDPKQVSKAGSGPACSSLAGLTVVPVPSSPRALATRRTSDWASWFCV